MIIDAHIHPSANFDHSDGYQDIMFRMAMAGIDLVIASDLGNWSEFPDTQTLQTANARLRDGAQRHAPRLQYLVYLNPQLPDWETELETHRSTAIGIKLWISLKGANGSLENTVSVLRRAAAIDLPVLIHVYHRTDGMRPGEINLNEFCDLCRAVPECTIIGAHAGGNWREARGRLRQLPPNKYYDISGGYPERDMVKQLVSSDGAERIVFGSDAIGRSFASQLAKVTLACISAEEKEQILWKNATKIFKLESVIAQLQPLPVRPKNDYIYPPFSEDHFCFCGSWPFTGESVTPPELANTLTHHGISRGFAVNLTDIFQSDLPVCNQRFATTCAEYPVIAPLAIVDPRRVDAFSQLNSMKPFAGIWVSPYLHNYPLDAPELAPFWSACAERQVKIWVNTSVSDYRFRSPSLAARPVTPDELYNFMKHVPSNHYTVQAWPLPNGVTSAANNGVWRFECSRLSDIERSPSEFFGCHDAGILVWGSEFPFRDYSQVYQSLTGTNPENIRHNIERCNR